MGKCNAPDEMTWADLRADLAAMTARAERAEAQLATDADFYRVERAAWEVLRERAEKAEAAVERRDKMLAEAVDLLDIYLDVPIDPTPDHGVLTAEVRDLVRRVKETP